MKNNKKYISPTDEDFGLVLNCAVRYSLGRRTYVPSAVCDFITPLIPGLSNKTLWCLMKDVESADNYGDEKIDKPVWMEFLFNIRCEMDRRIDNGR